MYNLIGENIDKLTITHHNRQYFCCQNLWYTITIINPSHFAFLYNAHLINTVFQHTGTSISNHGIAA